MGRGRAKAKQTKVARDLKYRTHEADFGALAAELHGGSHDDGSRTPGQVEDSDVEDEPDDDEPDDQDDDAWSSYTGSRRS